ncbi:MAG: hypothetical protein ACRDTA_22850 [Pseudonocardiaceae bacterium]
MGPSGEQPAGDSARQEAHASGDARINQAGRDLHVHYPDGVRRVEPGADVRECPYPGLASFGPEQARWFFGRDQLTAELTARLDARLHTGGVQVVVAPSGAGKSSLLHAGLLPQLDRGALPGSSRWPRMVFTPTAQPLAALATQITALTGADPATAPRCVELLRHHLGREDRVVVVVDQFEELFTLCPDDQQRRSFIELLSRLASPPHPVALVVVGIRADFYAACANYSRLRTALQDNPLVVGPMSDTELRAAILYPARDVALDVEPGLVELLLRDLGNTAGGMSGYEAGRLPLLAHALRATWQQRHGHTLTVDGYRSTGGIHRAVATTADRVFDALDPAGQHAARPLFLRLIKIGDGTEDTRRRMSRADLLQGLDRRAVGPVLDAFTQSRLLTQDQDTVEITHEALVRAWPRLRQWIDTDWAGNLIRQELDEAAAVWDRDRRDTAGLYRGSRLEAARAWATSASQEGDLSPTATVFLAASTQHEHRAARLRRAVLVVLSVLALVASGAAVFAFDQRATAQSERDTAVFNGVTAQADRLRSTDVSLAAQLDLTAYRMRPNNPDRYTALVTDANAALSTPLTGHTDTVNAVAFSLDGYTLATGSDDQTVRLWNATDPTHPTSLGPPLTGHTDAVNAVAFTRDGRTLATGSADQTVRLWNVTDPAHPTPLGTPLTGHTSSVLSVVFSPDGHTLATGGGDDQTVRLWNLTDPTHPTPLGQPLTGHTSAVLSVAFSPDGRTLATGSRDQSVRLWTLTDPAQPTPLGTPLTGHTDTVYAVAFSPDGHRLATGSGDQTVRLWNVTDPAQPTPLGTPLTGHTSVISAVVFSSDGHTLATGNHDQTVRLWDIPYALMTGHTDYVRTGAFGPDGHTLATGSRDHTVRLWNLTDPAHPTPLGQPLTGHTDDVRAVVFSPDGHSLATGSADQTVRLWNVTDPTRPTPLGQPLTGHTSSVLSVAFGPDGRTLATGSADQTVRLWNVTDPTRPTPLGQPLTGHTHTVYAVAFSPDGRTLASGSADRTLRLWNVTDPAHPTPSGTPLTGHDNWVHAVAFSPDGRTLVTGSDDQTVRLWNVADPAHPTPLGQPLTGHTNVVPAVVFSPDGRTLVSGSADRTLRLWNVTDPAHPTPLGQSLIGHTDFINTVAFSPDGRTLASGSGDKTVRLWGMNVDQAIQRICATTRNTLTLEKWKQYVSPDLPYDPPCP